MGTPVLYWPFVSRARFDEAIAIRDSQIAKLEKEKAELEKERRRLLDFIAVRSNGISIYGEIKAPKDEPESEPEEKDTGEMPVIPPTRARSYQRQREKHNRDQFEKEQAEADRIIAEAIEEGRQAAEAQAAK